MDGASVVTVGIQCVPRGVFRGGAGLCLRPAPSFLSENSVIIGGLGLFSVNVEFCYANL